MQQKHKVVYVKISHILNLTNKRWEARGVNGAQNQPTYDSGKAYICPWCRSSPCHPTQNKWTIHRVCKKHEDSINTIYIYSPVQQHTVPHSLRENHINFVYGYLNLCTNTNKCTCTKYVSWHVITYQHVSNMSAIIISNQQSKHVGN